MGSQKKKWSSYLCSYKTLGRLLHWEAMTGLRPVLRHTCCCGAIININ
jgi:hypothetical protein